MNIFTKEKQFILIKAGEGKFYKFDMNNLILYGLSGKPVKDFNSEMHKTLRLLTNKNNGSNVADLIVNCPTICTSKNHIENAISVFSGADRLDSLNIYLGFTSEHTYFYYRLINENFADYLAWQENNIQERNNMWKFHNYIIALNIQREYNTPLLNQREALAIDSCFKTQNLSNLEKEVVIHYVVKQKIFEYDGGLSSIKKYIACCRELNITPRKTNCFTREFVELLRVYELNKEQLDNEKFTTHYNSKSKVWEFTYDDYYIYIPHSPKELPLIGATMHNCVGSYVSSVINGIKFVVFVKKFSNPNDFCFAVEIDISGYIHQFKKPYNNTDKTSAEHSLVKAFKEHIANTW